MALDMASGFDHTLAWAQGIRHSVFTELPQYDSLIRVALVWQSGLCMQYCPFRHHCFAVFKHSSNGSLHSHQSSITMLVSVRQNTHGGNAEAV